MKVELVAIKPEEGKAFYREDNKLYFLEPLYEKAIPCERGEMEIVIKREGYALKEIGFTNFKEVVDYVRDEYERIRAKEGGLDIPSEEQLQSVVHKVSDELLLEYIEKAITAWIPFGKLDAAKLLLNDLVNLPNIQGRNKLFDGMKQLQVVIKAAVSNRPLETSIIPAHESPSLVHAEDEQLVIIQRNFASLNQRYNGFQLFTVLMQKRRTRSRSFGMVPCP